LDLLVICVEVGLGLDQALLRVAQELRIVHRELSEELQMVNLEMRVGKSRLEALKELARRTGSADIKSLVGMLVQTERFGTSVAQSLRIHSDELRTKRRQRAEEMSAKTTVKMVGPLVFFIFPALIAVILGPAMIALMRQLMPGLKWSAESRRSPTGRAVCKLILRRSEKMDTITMIRVGAGILAVLVLLIIIWRRRGKALE
jgi:tight adherence protein C